MEVRLLERYGVEGPVLRQTGAGAPHPLPEGRVPWPQEEPRHAPAPLRTAARAPFFPRHLRVSWESGAERRLGGWPTAAAARLLCEGRRDSSRGPRRLGKSRSAGVASPSAARRNATSRRKSDGATRPLALSTCSNCSRLSSTTMRRGSAGFLATPRRCRSCLRPFLAAAPVRPRVPLQPPRPARPLRQSLADFLVQHSLRVPLGEGVTLIGSWPCWAHYWAHLFPLSIEARAPGRALSSTQARCGSRRGISASAAPR